MMDHSVQARGMHSRRLVSSRLASPRIALASASALCLLLFNAKWGGYEAIPDFSTPRHASRVQKERKKKKITNNNQKEKKKNPRGEIKRDISLSLGVPTPMKMPRCHQNAAPDAAPRARARSRPALPCLPAVLPSFHVPCCSRDPALASNTPSIPRGVWRCAPGWDALPHRESAWPNPRPSCPRPRSRGGWD